MSFLSSFPVIHIIDIFKKYNLVFDFSNKELDSCFFSNYNSLLSCKFNNNTVFKNSVIDKITYDNEDLNNIKEI